MLHTEKNIGLGTKGNIYFSRGTNPGTKTNNLAIRVTSASRLINNCVYIEA
ncbi:hypothetical protein SPHINGO8BC_150525 [Sphingobacterium multivorum]|uniref:Uncharacterized protein n=1 Tax=Sphingobacterium multivorum TaxID=28454 RepID=A0A654ARJ6_SPHMU|nr:hypothetical protein SPHINGO8BC_150525 [Sphingobacterium multivorum]